jgi:hypothetical protein
MHEPTLLLPLSKMPQQTVCRYLSQGGFTSPLL